MRSQMHELNDAAKTRFTSLPNGIKITKKTWKIATDSRA